MPEYRPGPPSIPNFAEEGNTVPIRSVINVQGGGATIRDDPIAQQTILEIPGGGGSAVYAQLSIPGDLVTSTGIAKWRFHTNGTLRSLTADLGLASTTQSVVLDVKKHVNDLGAGTDAGTTIFPTPADRLIIPRGQTFSGLKNITGVTFTPNDTFTIDVTQAGTPPQAIVEPIGWQVDPTVNNVATYNVTRPVTPNTSGAALGARPIEQGDLLIFWMRATTVSGPWTAPPGQGWAELGTPTAFPDGTLTSQIFYRRDDGTPGPWTFSGVAASTVLAHKWWARNVDPTNPINASGVLAATGVPNSPAITPTVDGAGIVLSLQLSSGFTRPAVSGYTSRIGFDGTTLGTRMLADDTQTASATIASFTLGGGTGTNGHVTSHIALKPAPLISDWSPGAALSFIARATES